MREINIIVSDSKAFKDKREMMRADLIIIFDPKHPDTYQIIKNRLGQLGIFRGTPCKFISEFITANLESIEL